MEYSFTQNWFNVSELKRVIVKVLNAKNVNKILEIGCFEGQSSVFFGDHFLNHPDSELVCVDPFLNIADNDHASFLNNVERRFESNISKCLNVSKIKVYKVKSDSFFNEYLGDKFNFIYIDGCHEPDVIENDMKNAIKLLTKNGIIWMDDYLGGSGDYKIKNRIDKVLSDLNLEHKIEIIHRGYQIGFMIN